MRPLSITLSSLYRVLGRSAVIACVCLMAAAANEITAQTVQSQPVARLITTSDESVFPKPRAIHLSIDGSKSENELVNSSGLVSLEQALEVERRAFNVTNDARVQKGLSPLTWDAELCKMARLHSENMARRGFFSHQTPEGQGLKDRARSAGILHFRVMGENIAYNQGFEDPGAFAVERWLTSSQHRENILSREFSASAVGTFIAADGKVFLTQIFILR